MNPTPEQILIERWMAQRVASSARLVDRWMAQRVAYRFMVARTYKEYVKDKDSKGETPLSEKEWRSLKNEDSGEKEDSGGKGSWGGKIKGLLKSIPNVSKKMAEALAAAPAKTQQFFVDKEYRNQVTKDMAKTVKEGKSKAVKSIVAAGKKELNDIFVKTPKILYSMAKEKRLPTKEEAKTLYGVGVYVVGTALGTIGTGGLGGAAFGASKAFTHSLSLHMAIGAASGAADQVFLAGEAGESALTAAGFADVLRGGSGNLPGIGHLFDAVRTVFGSETYRLAAEDEAKMEKLIEVMYDKVVSQLEKGLSDEDIKAVLQNG